MASSHEVLSLIIYQALGLIVFQALALIVYKVLGLIVFESFAVYTYKAMCMFPLLIQAQEGLVQVSQDFKQAIQLPSTPCL